jgi:hypothetical protein
VDSAAGSRLARTAPLPPHTRGEAWSAASRDDRRRQGQRPARPRARRPAPRLTRAPRRTPQAGAAAPAAGMAAKAKLEEADKLMKKANKLWAPSLLDMRLKPDWEGAAPLFEKAALAFRVRPRGAAPAARALLGARGCRFAPPLLDRRRPPARNRSALPAPRRLRLHSRSKAATSSAAARRTSAPPSRRTSSAAGGTRRSTWRRRRSSAATWASGARPQSFLARRRARMRRRGGRRRVRRVAAGGGACMGLWRRASDCKQCTPGRQQRTARRPGAHAAPLPLPTPSGADALARTAKQLEEASPADAHALYREALDMYEVDGKEGQVGGQGGCWGGGWGGAGRQERLALRRAGWCRQWRPSGGGGASQALGSDQAPRSRCAPQAGDVFRQAAACLARSGKFGDAAATLMRFGEACQAVNARGSQCKAYLAAVVAWLSAGNAAEAWQVSVRGLLGLNGSGEGGGRTRKLLNGARACSGALAPA